MTKLVATSVIRGSRRGESHGGVYLVDFEHQSVQQALDWNRADIDWQGQGWDRGLRGIAFDGDVVYVAASDELLAYTPDFKLVRSWRNPYLKHCHEIAIYERTLFLTSTGFDSILGFNLDTHQFDWAIHIDNAGFRFRPSSFDPMSDDGPLMLGKLQLNNVHCTSDGMYLTGLKTGGMLHFNGTDINMAVELPPGTNNAQPFRDGVLFNDSNDDVLRYTGRGEGAEDRAMTVPQYATEKLQHRDGATARAGFARGLCVLSDRVVAGGSSPATVTLHDLKDNVTLGSVNLSMDVRNTIHGLAEWPFDYRPAFFETSGKSSTMSPSWSNQRSRCSS
jgi:hypothetical protein